MPRLYNQATGETIGEITEEQLQFLVDHLEEEHARDQDYYIHRTTLDLFREVEGHPESLVALIEGAMGDNDDVDIAWE
jgi:processive 1,2-diacylglycerol beta-glucosyltransferase